MIITQEPGWHRAAVPPGGHRTGAQSLNRTEQCPGPGAPRGRDSTSQATRGSSEPCPWFWEDTYLCCYGWRPVCVPTSSKARM